MIKFLNYIKNYFTHHTIVQIKKDSGMLEIDKLYRVSYCVKYNKKNGMIINGLMINEVKESN